MHRECPHPGADAPPGDLVGPKKQVLIHGAVQSCLRFSGILLPAQEGSTMQTPKGDFHRRDFLKISTASTATAFGAFALAGNQAAMAYTQSSDTGSTSGAKASMTEEEIAALPRVTQELVAPPFAPEHEQVASGGPKGGRDHHDLRRGPLAGGRHGRGAVGHDIQRLGSRPARRLPSGRLRRADPPGTRRPPSRSTTSTSMRPPVRSAAEV